MTTFLWMLYLAFTFLVTFDVLLMGLDRVIHNRSIETSEKIIACLAALLWSFWYFYYLH